MGSEEWNNVRYEVLTILFLLQVSAIHIEIPLLSLLINSKIMTEFALGSLVAHATFEECAHH